MDTIFALASGRPPAAIGLIRVSGPLSHQIGARLTGTLPPARQAALRTFRHPETGEILDRGLVLRFDAPSSSTGEDMVELHCHGGRAVVDAMLDALLTLEDARPARPGEFTRRAFENGRIDLTEAEGLADLIEAETDSQRKAALAIAEGGLRRQIEAWQERLLTLSARAESAIDYADERDEEYGPELSRDCGSLALELKEWLVRPRIEPLKDGVRIVVAGPPNVGKSSLINAIAGQERAIVTDIPGTTRDHIEVPLAISGLPVLLTDTAGLRDSDDTVERIGIERTRGLVDSADILVWLGEPEEAPAHPRLVRVHSKADLPGHIGPPGSLSVSAVTGLGLGELLDRLSEIAQDIVPAEGAIALNRRQAMHLEEARKELQAVVSTSDFVLLAENLRVARTAFDRLTGRAGMEDLLDALFSRFCLGK